MLEAERVRMGNAARSGDEPVTTHFYPGCTAFALCTRTPSGVRQGKGRNTHNPDATCTKTRPNPFPCMVMIMKSSNQKPINVSVTFVGLKDGEHAPRFAVYQIDTAGRATKKEIGRASCRERVCQYV